MTTEPTSPPSGCSASVGQTTVRGNWMQIELFIETPLQDRAPGNLEVVYWLMYARVEGLHVLEVTSDRPKCFGLPNDTPVRVSEKSVGQGTSS